jgi:parallel beta-helix repeat protein
MGMRVLMTMAIVLAMTSFAWFRAESVGASGIIYIEADGSVNPPEAPVFTSDNRTYILSDNVGSIVVERNNIVLEGAGHSAQGRGIGFSGTGIYLGGRSNVEVRNLRIEAFDIGVLLGGSWNVSVVKDEIASNEYGIQLSNSSGNTISENDIFINSFGIGFADQSDDNTVFGNKIRGNYDGFWLRHCSGNKIFANSIAANDMYSLAFLYSSNNTVYGNNLVSNQQIFSEESANIWDDGYPSGGNYWGGYSGVDENRDGILDSPYMLDQNNTDDYPLAGAFLFYEFPQSAPELLVTIVSNSTVSALTVSTSPNHPEQRTIQFNVTTEGASGFCRVCIPVALMNESYRVVVDGAEPQYVNYSIAYSSVNRWIYIAYSGFGHQITIVPEFSSLIVLLLFGAATLLAVQIRDGHVCRT